MLLQNRLIKDVLLTLSITTHEDMDKSAIQLTFHATDQFKICWNKIISRINSCQYILEMAVVKT